MPGLIHSLRPKIANKLATIAIEIRISQAQGTAQIRALPHLRCRIPPMNGGSV
ncbi:MAG TPA: hypothetical protein VME46_10810 [Acidimicrobiales bacterium]|nr:hypothetical protein [Acidimicrobiales bacterium]